MKESRVERLRPLGPTNAIGYMAAVHLLEDRKVSAFVYDLRVGFIVNFD